MFTDTMNTPAGILLIQASTQGIRQVDFIETDQAELHPNELTTRCKKQLQEYFEGKRTSFDLPLDQQGYDFPEVCLERAGKNSLRTGSVLSRYCRYGE